MNIQQQRAALAKLSPKSTKAVQADDTTLRDTVVSTIAAAPIAVTAFFGDIKTSYQYHKAVRQGHIK